MYKCTMTPGDPSITGAVNPETLKSYTHEAYDVGRACRSVTKAANMERAGSAGLSDVWKQTKKAAESKAGGDPLCDKVEGRTQLSRAALDTEPTALPGY